MSCEQQPGRGRCLDVVTMMDALAKMGRGGTRGVVGSRLLPGGAGVSS